MKYELSFYRIHIALSRHKDTFNYLIKLIITYTYHTAKYQPPEYTGNRQMNRVAVVLIFDFNATPGPPLPPVPAG